MISLAGTTRARARATATDGGTVALQQRVRYEYDRPVANLRQRLVVVPRARHGNQRRLSWRLAVDGPAEATGRAWRDRFGNVIVDVHVPTVAGHVEFVVDVAVEHGAAVTTHRDRLVRPYLRPSALTAADAAIARLVAAAPEPTAAALCAHVHRALAYEWGITGVRTTAADALAGGRGVCQDYAHVMVAACRSVGIAARYVSGHLHGEGGSHAWVEVLEPDTDHRAGAVVAWDPTNDRRAEGGYLTVAVGRDYTDVAPISGTYDTTGPTEGRLTVTKVVDAV